MFELRMKKKMKINFSKPADMVKSGERVLLVNNVRGGGVSYLGKAAALCFSMFLTTLCAWRRVFFCARGVALGRSVVFA
jgi:hypothetical protein